MLFSEIYSSYFHTVARILQEAVREPVNSARMHQIIRENAFMESSLSIPQAIADNWHLLAQDGTSFLRHAPTMPLSMLQRRWLKALLLDPRIALFDVSLAGLEDVEPLFKPQMFYYYDRYDDGDDYQSPKYQKNFKLIMQALEGQQRLVIEFLGGRNKWHRWYCCPLKLEYSAKDDKFRLNVYAFKRILTINVGRILKCSPADVDNEEAYQKGWELFQQKRTAGALVMQIKDERNALERVLLHFSHLAKKCERLDDSHYRLQLEYDVEDETEMLIRVLSFGPMVRVEEPASFVENIKRRLGKQCRIN